MAMADVDGSSLRQTDSWLPSSAQCSRYIHRMNQMSSCNGLILVTMTAP